MSGYLMYDGHTFIGWPPLQPLRESAEQEDARAEGSKCERPGGEREADDQSDRTSADEGPPDA